MPLSLAERNPCPKCGKRPALMPGIALDLGGIYVLVCWSCMMARKVLKGEEWGALKKRKSAIAWKKHSRTHWQTIIRGEVLDYWPTKKKWRFNGATGTGDVNQFIRSQMALVSPPTQPFQSTRPDMSKQYLRHRQ